MKSIPFHKFKLTNFVLILLILIGSCQSSEDPDPVDQSQNGITGVVTDQVGNAFANAKVNLEENGVFISQQTTDGSGNFQFANLSFSTYDLNLILPKTTIDGGTNPQTVMLQDVAGAVVDFMVSPQPYAADLVLGATDILGEVRTQTGEIPTDPDDLLYAVNVFSNQMRVPILAPDQHHVKLSEWQTAQGSVTMTCLGNSTKFDFEFTGLLSEGVYTLWIAPMSQGDILGTGAIGSSDGSQNVLPVDSNGDGATTITMSAGDLSVFGTLSTCALTVETSIALILDYHIDGNTHGSVAGPDPTEVGHMIFTF